MTKKTTCPRLKYERTKDMKAHRFLVRKDPEVKEIAQMVVAGIDQRYSIHPCYRSYVHAWGKERAQELIQLAVSMRGSCDVLQTHDLLSKRMGVGGATGLFGGLGIKPVERHIARIVRVESTQDRSRSPACYPIMPFYQILRASAWN